MPSDDDHEAKEQRFLEFARKLPPLPTGLLAVNLSLLPQTKVVSRRHTNQWDVYIGRPSIFGNSHHIKQPCRVCSTPDNRVIHKTGEAMAFYKEDFLKQIDNDPEFRKAVLGLRGKILACWCKSAKGGGSCHGDIIVEWLEAHSE